MEHLTPKASSAKISIVGLFAVLTFALTLPIALLFSQEKQDVRSKAAEPTPNQQLKQTPGSVVISGYVYYDNNKNGERDLEEKPYPGVRIKMATILLQKEDIQEDSTVITDSNGFFKFHFSHLYPDTSNYMIKLLLPNGYKTINTNPLIMSDLPQEAKETLEFGLFPTSIK
jgi:hypothetical protein